MELAQRIDTAVLQKDEYALLLLISGCEARLEAEKGESRTDLYYFMANALAGIFGCKDSENYRWSWEQTEGVSELLALRKAITEPSFESAGRVRKYQIRTNLASRLNSLGRTVEAIEQWDKALLLIPKAAMASGNRALGICSYSNGLYDHGHAGILLSVAEDGFRTALDENAFWDSGPHEAARSKFSTEAARVTAALKQIAFDHDFDLDKFSLGESPPEQAYRQWCLSEKLFLNPLNDVTTTTVAASDVLHLPSHIYSIDDTPRFPAYYNHLKQEYVSARYRLFKSLDGLDGHFVDRDVLLFDNADAAEFGHLIDELKIAYRSAYALFDKIGLFLNDYFSVGLKVRDVYFRRIWEETVKGSSTPTLRSRFVGNKNWALRGLYYLSKDLFDAEFEQLAEPDAKELSILRNKAEHRFLSLTQYDRGNHDTAEHAFITSDDFSRKAKRMVRMARAALIYLSLAMFREEEIRKTCPPLVPCS